MMSTTLNQIEQQLHALVDPHTHKTYHAQKSFKKISLDKNQLSVEIELPYPARSQFALVENQVRQSLVDWTDMTLHIEVSSRISAHTVQGGVKLLPNVKNIIAIASGKGGVGKSTTSANIALALAAEGAKVGLLDADIYGPSQAMMMGVSGKPETLDGITMEPLENYGVQIASMGLLVEADSPMIWRGPMAAKYMQQLLEKTNWKEVDYLIIDMPPGTGDIQLSLTQSVPLTGAVIVTTPQDIALLDAKKGLKMFEKVSVPILGVIENMSLHTCSQCGHTEALFGEGGGQKMCQEYGVSFLGGLPLSLAIRLQADSGKPTVVADPESHAAQIYQSIARKIAIAVADKAKDFSHKFPNISFSAT